VPAREEVTQADFVTALTDVIRQPTYASKFVVDGLNALPENLDIDQFLDHALKMGGLDAQLARNPFYIIQSTSVTAREPALVYVRTALDSSE
jgi:hypothetical protein